MDERKAFLEGWEKGENSFAELCRQYGISRQTGYKWQARFATGGAAGMQELSRAPHHCPQGIGAEVSRQIIALRQQHPRWGPRKLRAYLVEHGGKLQWPATSSIGDLLRREGLVAARRHRDRTVRYQEPLIHAQAANQVWCGDFKGYFVCGNGERCDPLTITDAFSRFLFRCRSVAKTDGPHVRGVFEAVFREYGLPEAIRTDNGPPFATTAPGGLSRLNIWWMRLGIRHERIEPGCPEQNGRHERMHQTLKQETAMPPAFTRRQQQQALERFQQEYNYERPHEALGYRTPASAYVPSPRPYPARLPEPQYPAGAILRLMDPHGQFRWVNNRVFVTKALGREYIGLVPIAEAFYEVYYGGLLLGWFDEAENYFAADRGPRHRRPATEAARHAQAPPPFPESR
jgi:transposase InsO family protein